MLLISFIIRKPISTLYLNNNVYVYIDRDEAKENQLALYPMSETMSTVMEYQGKYYIRFDFQNGKTFIQQVMNDVIHLRRFYCENDFMGGNNTPKTKNT